MHIHSHGHTVSLYTSTQSALVCMAWKKKKCKKGRKEKWGGGKKKKKVLYFFLSKNWLSFIHSGLHPSHVSSTISTSNLIIQRASSPETPPTRQEKGKEKVAYYREHRFTGESTALRKQPTWSETMIGEKRAGNLSSPNAEDSLTHPRMHRDTHSHSRRPPPVCSLQTDVGFHVVMGLFIKSLFLSLHSDSFKERQKCISHTKEIPSTPET